MSDTSIYVFIILFIVIFIILFIENIKKRYIPFVTRKERMNYPVIKVLPSCFVRSLLRSFSIIIPLIIIYIFLAYIYDIIIAFYDYFQNNSNNPMSQQIELIFDKMIVVYKLILNLPSDTYYISLVIATLFCVNAIISIIFIFIKKVSTEIKNEMPSLEEVTQQTFSLDDDISRSLNPTVEDLNSFIYDEDTRYKSFILFENLNILISILILWSLENEETIKLIILSLSLLIITNAAMLRTLSGYLNVVKENFTFIHKIQIYIVSVIISISSIFVSYIYLEEDPFHLTTVLIITTLLSFISLHTGKNKRKKMEKDIKEHNSFLNFLKNSGLR